MKRLLQFALPLAIIAGAVWLMNGLIASREEPARRKPPTSHLRVDAVSPSVTSYQVTVPTRGTVRPRTRSKPSTIASRSASVSMPCRASMVA